LVYIRFSEYQQELFLLWDIPDSRQQVIAFKAYFGGYFFVKKPGEKL
jgi:hypothetical protein